MTFKSILKPQESIASGLAVAGIVLAIYSRALPDMATAHATAPNDINIDAARRKAAWMSTAVISGITLLTRDANILISGGVMMVGSDWFIRHANATAPDTGQLVSNDAIRPATKLSVAS